MIVSSCAETVWIDELDEASEGSYMHASPFAASEKFPSGVSSVTSSACLRKHSNC